MKKLTNVETQLVHDIYVYITCVFYLLTQVHNNMGTILNGEK